MKKLSNLLLGMTPFFWTATLIAGCSRNETTHETTPIVNQNIDRLISIICFHYSTSTTPDNCPWISQLATAQFDEGIGKNYLLSAVFENEILPKYVKFSPGKTPVGVTYTKFLKNVPIKINISYDFEYYPRWKIHKINHFWIILTDW